MRFDVVLQFEISVIFHESKKKNITVKRRP